MSRRQKMTGITTRFYKKHNCVCLMYLRVEHAILLLCLFITNYSGYNLIVCFLQTAIAYIFILDPFEINIYMRFITRT